MARHPLFLDDDAVAAALDGATEAAVCRLSELLPELGTTEGAMFRNRLRAHLAAMVAGRPGATTPVPDLPHLVHGEDAFGDRFTLEELPLPRTGTGYAVQMLDTDRLLDRASGGFLEVRNPALDGLFETFDSACAAARAWLRSNNATIDDYPLTVIPAQYDRTMERHVLIYGVLTRSP